MGVDGALEIGVGEDDEGRLAAEFQRGGGEVLGRVAHHRAPGIRAAGEGDVVDARVPGEGRAAGRAEAGDDVDDTGRKARFVDEPGEGEERAGTILGGLHDEGAAGCERRADLDRREEELAVPGHDRGADADRLAPGPDLEVGLVDRQVRAFDLVGEAGVIAVVVGDIGDLRRGLADDLAGIARLDLGQRAGMGGDQLREPGEELAARGCGHRRPRAGLEGAPGGGDGAVDVALAGLGHLGPGRARCRIEAGETGLAVLEGAVDILLEGFPGQHGVSRRPA